MGEAEAQPRVEPGDGPGGRTTAPPPRRLGLVAGVTAAAVAVDQLSKEWALERLPEGPIHVAWTLDLRLTFNSGAAFSVGSGEGLGPFITLLALVVLVALVLGSSSRSRSGAAAVGLVAGGALGNLADRAFRSDDGFLAGHVVDFIDLNWWPVFNVADACIVVGALALLARSVVPASTG